MSPIPWLSLTSYEFPPLDNALDEPNGLLAAGGDLHPGRLLAAYKQGIFPWYNPEDPILWWSPQPRTVVFPSQLHISRSLEKWLRKAPYRITFDHAFSEVMHACAAPRDADGGTWINSELIASYTRLHQLGYGHSVEVWQNDTLVGGLYGLAIGKLFFGESMFSRADIASKIGFVHLVQQLQRWEFQLIDCQVASEHLHSLGAEDISRHQFQKMLIHFGKAPRDYPLHWHRVTANYCPHKKQ